MVQHISGQLDQIPKHPNEVDNAGLKQGKWTILLDSTKTFTVDSTLVSHYRIINYKNGTPEGMVKEYNLNGDFWEGKVSSDIPFIREGLWTRYYKTGKKRTEIRYQQNVAEGPAKWYYANGQVSSQATYVRGRENGLSIWYNENGTRQSEGFFEDNRKHGIHKWYFKNGNLFRSITFDHDVMTGEVRIYHENGKISEVLEYKNDQREGPFTSYDINGALIRKGTYKNNEIHGIFKGFYPSGGIKFIAQIEYGKRNGTIEHYDQDGIKTVVDTFVNDEFVGTKNLREQTFLAAYNLASDIDEGPETYEIIIAGFEKALDLAKKENITSGDYLATAHHTIGRMYFKLKKYKEAEQYYLKAAALYLEMEGKYGVSYSGACHNTGVLYHDMGQFGKAELYLNKALLARQKNAQASKMGLARTYNQLGLAYYSMQRYKQSRSSFQEALKIYETKLDPSDRRIVMIRFNLTYLPGEKNSFSAKENIDNLEKLITQLDKNNNEFDQESVLLLHLQLANFYSYEENYTQADTWFDTSELLWKKSALKDSLIFAKLSANRGSSYAEREDYKNAETYFRTAKKVQRKIRGTSHPEYIRTAFELAESLEKQLKFHEAVALYTEIISSEIDHLNDNSFNLISKDRRSYFVNRQAYINEIQLKALELKDKAPEFIGALYNLALNIKFYLLRSAILFKTAVRESNDPSITRLFEEWSQLQFTKGRAYNTGRMSNDYLANTLKTAIPKSFEIEKDLIERTSKANIISSREILSWQKIQSKLKKDEAALEVIRSVSVTEDGKTLPIYAILIIKGKAKSKPEIVVFDDGVSMEDSALEHYQRHIARRSNPDEDTKSYLSYWEKMEKHLSGIKKIYFSPDGVYNIINIETLYNPKTDLFLGEEIQIQKTYGISQLLESKTTKTKQKNALLYGDIEYHPKKGEHNFYVPDSTSITIFTAPSNVISGFFKKIGPLPETLTEIQKIKDILETVSIKVSILDKIDASEESLRNMQSPAILHIATHAFFQKFSTNSFYIDDEGLIHQEMEVEFEDKPNLSTGILMSNGGNAWKSGGDGILTSFEAANLNLSQTDLVVLSACETGAGDMVQGQATSSLGSAFLEAGAKNIIMSLWKVDDQITREFMISFYQHWLLDKDSITLAFSKAQADIRNKPGYASPYYWGSFLLLNSSLQTH
jgi:CHAT domain-containing protein/antitoxin component YwqK of YwqJK toxin-antitoxin module/Tfp pilus assembly protein PilF